MSGVWLIESNTDTEVSITAEGLDEADSLRPEALEGYTPRHRVIAAYGYLGNQYKLDLSGVRHQSADLPAVIVDDCRVLSVVTREGRAMHQLSLRLRGNGRQFFPVGLPAGEGLRLLSLVVDGAAAKPVAGPDGAVMIPLPQDAGQGRQVLAQLVYEGNATPFLSSGTVKLQPPVFDPKTPVLAAGWDLVLPERFTYRNWNSTFLTPEEEQPGKILPLLKGHFKPLEMLGALLGILREPVENNMKIDFLPGGAATTNDGASDVGAVASKSEPMAAPSTAAPEALASSSKADVAPPAAKPVDAAQRAKERKEKSAMIAKINSITIPKIKFEDASLAEAIDFLVAQSRALDKAATDPTKKGTPIILRQDAAAANAAKITLTAKDMPLSEALRYVTDLAGMKYKVESDMVMVVPITSVTEEFFTRVIQVSPDFLTRTIKVPKVAAGGDPFGGGSVAGRGPATTVSGSDLKRDAKAFLITCGIQFPEGSKATFVSESSQLVIRNTATNVDLIEEMVTGQTGQFKMEQGFYDIGDLDRAEVEYTDVLRKDRYNRAARRGVEKAGQERQLDRVGILPLLIELPESGVHVQLTGDHAPQALDFGYVTWERGARVAWLAILGGALLYGALVFRRRRWVFLFFVGAVLLTFVPPLFGAAAVRFGNGLLLGWLGMFFIKVASVMMRPRQVVIVPPAPTPVAATSI